MTSVEKPTDALNVELLGKQGCFQLARLAAIGIHHSGVAPCRQHIYTSTQCRRRTRCTSNLRVEDDVCETMPTAAAARPVSGLMHAEQKQQQCGHEEGCAAALQPPHQRAGRRRRGLKVRSSTSVAVGAEIPNLPPRRARERLRSYTWFRRSFVPPSESFPTPCRSSPGSQGEAIRGIHA